MTDYVFGLLIEAYLSHIRISLTVAEGLLFWHYRFLFICLCTFCQPFERYAR